ncbi:MAG: LysM domain-containing protein [Chloroflexota bacterium]
MKHNSITRVLAAMLLAVLLLSAAAPSLAANSSFTYTAKKGDQYSDLSWRYGVSLTRLLAANEDINGKNWLTPGQLVVVPVELGSTPSLVNPWLYRTGLGDTLGLLSVRYEIAAWAVAKVNGLSAADLTKAIPANTNLLIPAGPHIHKLGDGETLADVAAQYGVSVSYLLKVNKFADEAAAVTAGLITIPIQYDRPFTPMSAAVAAPVVVSSGAATAATPAPTSMPTLTGSGGPLTFRWVGVNSGVTTLGAGRGSVVLAAEFKGGAAPNTLRINSWGQYATTRGPFTKVDDGQAWIDLDFDVNFQCGQSIFIDATVSSADGQSAQTIRSLGPLVCP